MIKRLLVFSSFLLFAFVANAQTYCNEWINYNQNYYKIKVAANGVYRIDSTTLANTGISVAGIDPRNFQIYNKGGEQYVYVQGEGDGVFNGSDFIEFYGEKNDGKLDSAIYVNTPFIPNPYYSLFNDTAIYFLTYNASTTNRRVGIETDTTFSSFPDTSKYFYLDYYQDYHTNYYNGETDYAGGTDARYSKSEGWFDAYVIDLGVTNTYTLNTPNAYSGGPDAQLKSVAVGASKHDGSIVVNGYDHHLKIMSGAVTVADTLFKGYAQNRFISSFPISSVGSTTAFAYESVADAVLVSNRTAVSYINLKYPHTYDFEANTSYTFYLPNDLLQLKSNVVASNFTASGNVFIYDLSNAKRMSNVIADGANYRVLIPNSSSGNEKKCFITSDGNVMNVNASMISPINASAHFINYSTLAVDSAYIIITHKSLMNSALNYKTYRSSINGGLHNVVLADVDELYDEFAYGIMKSPLAIRNFCHYILDSFPTPAQNLLLLGKSIHAHEARDNQNFWDIVSFPIAYSENLVPSLGNPACDNLLTAGLNGTLYSPAIPTGRISARTPLQVDDYLQKIVEFEGTPPDKWKKQVLHFGGGSDPWQQAVFKNYLERYADTIQRNYFGGNVYPFYKTSTAPISINTSDTLTDFINNGVSLMTFFGHGSGQGFDQSIDSIGSYNPLPGHYPFLLGNSCFSGDLHKADVSFSELYVLHAQKGMIGFLGSVSLGVPYALDLYSNEFYRRLDSIDYGKTVGRIIKNTIEHITITDSIIRNTCFEMALHGDPAVRISPGDKPDYNITGNDLSFDVTTIPESLIVSVTRHNFGKSTNDSSFTYIVRTFPSGIDSVTKVIFGKEPYYQDVVTFQFPINYNGISGYGLNKFRVVLDKNNVVDEYSEDNNSTGEVDLLITGGDILPVYPYEFAIVNTDTITLKASTSDMFAPVHNYYFQIDTTDKYTSVLATTGVIAAPGGVVKWNPHLMPFNFPLFTDSTVYFWRVCPDTVGTNQPPKWREFSFQYIVSGFPGWEQADFFQFKKENDGYQYVKQIDSIRRYDFVNDKVHLVCNNGTPLFSDYRVNGNVQDEGGWSWPGWTFVAFNTYTIQAIQNFAIDPSNGIGQYGSYCWQSVQNAFDFTEYDSISRQAIVQFFQNPNIPHGDYVLGYTEGHIYYSTYDPALKNILIDSLGASALPTIADDKAYIIFNKKGAPPGSATEIISDSSETIKLDTLLDTHWNQGFIASPVIGPGYAWHSLHYRWHSLDGPANQDSIWIKVIGIKANGTEQDLAHFNEDSLDVLDLANYVNADTFPTIRLIAYMSDDAMHTPPQIERWHVVYDPVPECALNPPYGYTNYNNDTLEQGENFKVNMPIQNIGNIPFTTDSLLMNYWIVDAAGTSHPLPSKLKKKPFNVNEVIVDSIVVNTVGFAGKCALWVEANPVNKLHSQLEQYHFNNITRIPFSVAGDHINPLLDVTFDGVHILNNDIVSAKPNILIKLKDENQFLALNDTNDFKIFVQSPVSGTAQRVYFGQYMTFEPAVLPNNSCKINYTPFYNYDGAYTLIVQAKDISSNQSGAVDYQIKFEIINKPSITEVMNYPNPFSTATHFVFTLTGSEVPSNFKIQILTISGKVVREIFQDEIGAMHVGRNITDYAWDGKDTYGDQLANGVYLYRVQTLLHGNDIEHRETEADQYFKKGWGKMFLMK